MRVITLRSEAGRRAHCMSVQPGQIPYRDFYQILLGSVAPRPIAWVSTLNLEGRPNLAPFSFFTALSVKPPLLGFCPALRRLEGGSAPKDTLRNIRDTGEFVVNVVTFENVEAMNLSSGEYDSFVNEFEVSRLHARPSQMVRPPQVAESPVSFECKLDRVLDFGSEAPSGSLVIGEIVSVHVEARVLKGGRLHTQALDLVGRMGGSQYSRTTERFSLLSPSSREAKERGRPISSLAGG
jgi:flavin reductase (DIM6/NTAB) family NADH-FMN oxidoreductase RutF